MYWLFTDSTENKDTNIFYQLFNNSTVIEFNDFICYNAHSTSTNINTNINTNTNTNTNINTKSIIYDIYIKGNLIKYVNKDEERTFIYETDRISSISSVSSISSISNKLLVFKNSYKKTDNCKLPLLIDSCYDNIYKNIQFKITELPNNTLQIQSNNNNFIFILSKTPSL